MIRLINFKELRQSQEWKDDRLDGRLRIIVYALAGFAFDQFGKILVVTEVHRTEAERREIYKDDPVLRETVGVHEVWRAADLRTVGFTPTEVAAMLDFLNKHFEYSGGKYSTSVYHNVVGFHIHLQVDADGVTGIKGGPIEAPKEPSVDD